MKRRRSVLRSISWRMTSSTSSSASRSSVNQRVCSDRNDQLFSLRDPNAVVPMFLLTAWAEVAHRHRALLPAVVTSLITQTRIDLPTNLLVERLGRHRLLAESASPQEQALTIATTIGFEVMTGIRTGWSSAIGSTRRGTGSKRRAQGEHLLEATSSPRPAQTTQRPSIALVAVRRVANRVLAIASTVLLVVCAYPVQTIWATIRRRLMQHAWESTE